MGPKAPEKMQPRMVQPVGTAAMTVARVLTKSSSRCNAMELQDFANLLTEQAACASVPALMPTLQANLLHHSLFWKNVLFLGAMESDGWVVSVLGHESCVLTA